MTSEDKLWHSPVDVGGWGGIKELTAIKKGCCPWSAGSEAQSCAERKMRGAVGADACSTVRLEGQLYCPAWLMWGRAGERKETPSISCGGEWACRQDATHLPASSEADEENPALIWGKPHGKGFRALLRGEAQWSTGPNIQHVLCQEFLNFHLDFPKFIIT